MLVLKSYSLPLEKLYRKYEANRALDLSVLVDCVMFVTFFGEIHLNLMKFDNFFDLHLGPTTGFPSVHKMGVLLQEFGPIYNVNLHSVLSHSLVTCGYCISVSVRIYSCFRRQSVALDLSPKVFKTTIKIL